MKGDLREVENLSGNNATTMSKLRFGFISKLLFKKKFRCISFEVITRGDWIKFSGSNHPGIRIVVFSEGL